MDNVVIIVGLVSSVLTIIGYFLPINSRRARWVHAAYILVVGVAIGIATYQGTKLARLSDIATAADDLAADREMKYTHRGYVFAVLSFLEKNKDLFPDTYARAVGTCARFKCDTPEGDANVVELSFAFDGIVKGMGTISK